MVVDLPILRGTQGGRSLIEFLDFLQLPEVPPTEDVVAHLEHCMAENLPASRSEEHTSELQSLMRISYAVFCVNNKLTKQILLTRRDNGNHMADQHNDYNHK